MHDYVRKQRPALVNYKAEISFHENLNTSFLSFVIESLCRGGESANQIIYINQLQQAFKHVSGTVIIINLLTTQATMHAFDRGRDAKE